MVLSHLHHHQISWLIWIDLWRMDLLMIMLNLFYPMTIRILEIPLADVWISVKLNFAKRNCSVVWARASILICNFEGFMFMEVNSVRASSSKFTSCHFSSDGKLLASGGHDKKTL